MLDQIIQAKVEGFNEGRRIALNEVKALVDDKDRKIAELERQLQLLQNQNETLCFVIEEIDDELIEFQEELEAKDFANEVFTLALQKLLGY